MFKHTLQALSTLPAIELKPVCRPNFSRHRFAASEDDPIKFDAVRMMETQPEVLIGQSLLSAYFELVLKKWGREPLAPDGIVNTLNPVFAKPVRLQ